MFAVIGIVIWAFVFRIFEDPSAGQICRFILIGIGGPVSKWLIGSLLD